jgi:hypothetical protein
MLDAGRVLALIVAVVWSIRARSRLGLLAALAVGYVYVLEMASGFGARDRGPMSIWYAFTLAFWGPSGLPRGLLAGWPLAGFVMLHPLGTQLLTAACAAVPWRVLARRSSALRPESAEAYRLDRAALQFVLVFVLDVILCLLGGMLALLARDY